MRDVKGRPIGPSKVDRGLAVSTVAGAIGMVFFVSTSGAFLTGFLRKLGASQFQIGVINAFVPMSAVAQLLSSYMIERRNWRKKHIVCIGLAVMRLLWLPILLIPFALGIDAGAPVAPRTVDLAVDLALVLMALSQLIGGFGSLAWQAWMADLVPPTRRGRFFGVRTTVVNAVNVVASLAIGRYLDIHNTFAAFAVVFGLGVAFGVLDLVVHAFVPEPALVAQKDAKPFLRQCLHPFADARFSGLIWFTLAWNFAVWLMLPFLPVFQIEELGLSYLSISWFGNIFMLSMMVASPFVGRVIDKVGGRKAYVAGFVLLTASPVFWLAMDSSNAVPMSIVMNVFTGVLNACVNVANTQLMYANCPPSERSVYIAVFAAIGGISGTLGPIFGGWLGDAMAKTAISVAGMTLEGLKVVFAASLVLRLACLPLLSAIQSDRSPSDGRPASETLGLLQGSAEGE